MLSRHFAPIEISGLRFDKGMCLYEFSALREPEATRFPKIEKFIKSRASMVKIKTPSMYWNGQFFPDLYISNRLSELKASVGEQWPDFHEWSAEEHPSLKDQWSDALPLTAVSLEYHGRWFHETFIDPMCKKISGRPSHSIAAKYHRALWLPMYWPETLIAGNDLDTSFYYPKVGYAGYPLVGLKEFKTPPKFPKFFDVDTTTIKITYVVGKPKHPFSVLFVVDNPSIYRITDQDACANNGKPSHRYVVESSSDFDIDELSTFMDVEQVFHLNGMIIKMPIPTIRNVAMGWKPAPNLNEQIWQAMNGP